MILLQQVTKTYDYYAGRFSIGSLLFPSAQRIVALDNVCLEIKPGEIYGLLGPNGAGKTTLIKILAGLVKPSSGTARMNGREVFMAQKEMGLMLGDSLVYTLMTGRDNLDYAAHLYGVPNVRKRVEEVAHKLELGDWLDQYVSEYSLGMKVKICLARALIHDPPILLLDEPTLGLDPNFALELRKLIRELKKTIVLTTHYMEEAESLSDRVGILHHGHLVAEGTSGQLKERLAGFENPSLTDVFVELTRSD
jgi:ABC-2 type transport system ATP-binding protein